MQLTNKLRLPDPIVRAISNDNYTKGDADFSVTELLNPPQVRRLFKEFGDQVEEDASDRIWSLLGQAVHSIIERASEGDANTLSETTLYTTLNGHKIKGTFDNLTISNAELGDFKVTTVWKVRDGVAPDDWIAQTNIYRWMLAREKGIAINSMAVFAIFRDWSKREAAKRLEYPQAQAARIDIPLWDLATTEAFVLARLLLHTQSEVQPCSDEDIWAKPTKWAAMKKGRASAVKLFDNQAEAADFAKTLSSGYVEYRPGSATRCESYCAVAPFCKQWANDSRNQGDKPLSESLFNV